METAKDAFKQVEVIRTVTKSPDKICLNRFIIKLLSTYVHIVSLLRCMYILTVFEGDVNKILSIPPVLQRFISCSLFSKGDRAEQGLNAGRVRRREVLGHDKGPDTVSGPLYES